MIAIIGSILFLLIALLTFLAILGFPLGEYILGGKNRTLVGKNKIQAVVALFIQLFAVSILLQTGGIIPLLFSEKVTVVICYIFAVYLSLNVLMNAASRSKKERILMTPLSLIIAISFWITAINFNI